MASIISTNVLPRPPFAIGVVAAVGTAPRDVAVVRVEQGDFPPYMYVREQKNRISLRVGDRRVPASLRDLEDMFSRRNTLGASDAQHRVLMANNLAVKRRDTSGSLIKSDTHLVVWIRPYRPLQLSLDGQLERDTISLLRGVLRRYPRQPPVAEPEDVTSRDVDYFDLSSNAEDYRFQRTWRFCNDGSFALCIEVFDRVASHIFVFDLVDDLCRAILAARAIFPRLAAHGRMLIRCSLRLANAPVVSAFRDQRIAAPHGIGDIPDVPKGLDSTTDERPFSRVVDETELVDPSGIVADLLNRQLRALRGAQLEIGPFTDTISRYCVRGS